MDIFNPTEQDLKLVAGIPNIGSLRRVSVSKPFRDMVFSFYPSLKDKRSYAVFMQYLMFTNKRTEGGGILVNRYVPAACEGKIQECDNMNYSAKRFLIQFRRDVLPDMKFKSFEYGNREELGYVFKEGKARVVSDTGIDPVIESYVEDELERTDYSDTERVMFHNGKEYTKYYQRKERQRYWLMAKQAGEDSPDVYTKDIVDYLNDRSVRTFSEIMNRFPEAVSLACDILEGGSRISVLKHLRAIQDQHKPFYKPTDRSTRVYPTGPSLAGLQRDVREFLMQDYIAFDLKSAQLSICARLWGVDGLLEFLENGGDIWWSLYEGMDVGPGEKGYLKRLVYSICFGMSRDNLRSDAEEYGIDFDRFVSHEHINNMLKARDRQISLIKQEGGREDCFKRWLDTDEYSYASILAQLAQSVEISLMYPAISLAMQHTEIDIPLFLHDGFYLNVRDSSREKLWKNRIIDVVNKKCRQMDIPTELVES